MRKKTKSPLEQQADKRFLNQITGLDLDQEAKNTLQTSKQSGIKRLINLIKEIL